MQGLAAAQQQAEELANALESSQSDTVILSQALEEAQALLEQRGTELEVQAAESKARNFSWLNLGGVEVGVWVGGQS